MAKGLDEIRAGLLAKPGVRAAYDQLAPEYAVARAVIEARTRARLTRAQLAERMGSSTSYVARLESGRMLPSMRAFLRVAQATGTEPQLALKRRHEKADEAAAT